MNINGIQFEWTGSNYTITNKGLVLGAKLVGTYNHQEVVNALVGQQYAGLTFIGVEMFAVDDQTDRLIGIMVDK
jgi:hypothetical protein